MQSKLGIVVVVGTILLVGTSRPPRATPPTPPTDACALLTQAQVIAVLGVSVGPGQALMTKICKWSEPVRPGAPAKRVMVNLINPQAFVYAKTPVGNGIIKTEVSGIGEDAVYVSAPREPTTLTVKKSAAAFTVTVIGFSDDQTKAKEKTLALDIIAKL